MVGTGVTTTAAGNTDLESSYTSSRFSIANATRINSVLTLVGFLSPSQGNAASAITELGFFSASTSGDMLFRTVASSATFASFTKDTTKSALIQVDITYSS